jgi:peptide deformylase
LARVFQHETDHLQGVIFVDKVKKYTKGQELLSTFGIVSHE